jgi:murein DD-endopeptidase MepM/ murein hydrolase activator NlpD
LNAPRYTLIVAPEAGEVVEVRPRWYSGTGLLLLQTDSGPVLNLGEIEPDSQVEFGIEEGSRVVKGQPLARVGWHDQLHFEAYVDGTRATAQWRLGDPPPPSLLDPVPYLRLAAAATKPTVHPRPTTPTTPTMPTPLDPEPLPRSSAGGGLLLAVVAALALGAA